MTETRRRHRHAPDEHRAERRAERREALLDAAARVIRRDGAAHASMEAMAAEAGISKPILYRHFGDRAGLVAALGDRFAGALLGELTASLAKADDAGEPRAVLVETISTYLSFIERDLELYRFVAHRAPAEHAGATVVLDDFIRRVASQVAVVLGERMRAAGVDSGGAEPIAHGIVGLVHAAGDWWVDRRTMTLDALVDYLSQLLWDGLGGYGLAAAEGGNP